MASTSNNAERLSPTESVESVQESVEHKNRKEDGGMTIGAELIDKHQPWRNIVQPDKYTQPTFFSDPPAQKEEATKKIRLLAELDSKSR